MPTHTLRIDQPAEIAHIVEHLRLRYKRRHGLQKTVIITLFYEAALTVSGFNVIKRAESRDRCADGKAAHTVLLSQSRFGHQLLTGFIITGLKLLSENVEKLFCKPVSANYILCHMITSANVASCIIGI